MLVVKVSEACLGVEADTGKVSTPCQNQRLRSLTGGATTAGGFGPTYSSCLTARDLLERCFSSIKAIGGSHAPHTECQLPVPFSSMCGSGIHGCCHSFPLFPTLPSPCVFMEVFFTSKYYYRLMMELCGAPFRCHRLSHHTRK